MKTLLIVDDEFGLTETLCELVVLYGYGADKAWNGQLALQKVAERRPDLIVSDIMMPIMDGHQLLRALKASSEWRDIPVVLMSAATGLSPEELAESVGFLPKPFEISAFLAIIAQVIGPPTKE